MNVKSYLLQVRKCDMTIDRKLLERQRLMGMALSITAQIKEDGASGGGGASDKLGEAVAKIVDLDAEIDRQIDKLVDLKRKIISTIDEMDGQLSEVLSKRYLEYDVANGYKLKSWERIAVEMGFTYQWVCKLHGYALREFERKINAEDTEG